MEKNSLRSQKKWISTLDKQLDTANRESNLPLKIAKLHTVIILNINNTYIIFRWLKPLIWLFDYLLGKITRIIFIGI